MDYIKHSSIKLAKEAKLYGKEISFEDLLFAARQKGYIVRRYSTSADAMILYQIFERAKKSSSVCITDKDSNTVIFIDDSLPEPKQLFALAHELGHITLSHSPESQKKRRQEKEANLFAHYLLDTNFRPKRLNLTISILTGFLCLCISALFMFLPYMDKSAERPTTPSQTVRSSSVSESENARMCYYTEYGEVYHLYSDCYFLKNSKKIYSDSIKNCPKERLCSECDKRANKKTHPEG